MSAKRDRDQFGRPEPMLADTSISEVVCGQISRSVCPSRTGSGTPSLDKPTSPEPAAAPLVPVDQAAESLFAALAAEADEETAGA